MLTSISEQSGALLVFVLFLAAYVLVRYLANRKPASGCSQCGGRVRRVPTVTHSVNSPKGVELNYGDYQLVCDRCGVVGGKGSRLENGIQIK